MTNTSPNIERDIAISAKFLDGSSASQLAKEYGIGKQMIYYILFWYGVKTIGKRDRFNSRLGYRARKFDRAGVLFKKTGDDCVRPEAGQP